MRKVTICAWVLLMALMLMVPLAIAEDSSQPVVDNPITIENPANENQTGGIEEVIPEVAEESSLYYNVKLDAELDFYDPLTIVNQIEDGNIDGDTLLEKLNDLYSPDVEVVLAENMDNSWVLIDEDTTFAVGDILVSEDFTQIGIWVADNEVYDLSSGTVKTPADYFYYNQPLHDVNYDNAISLDKTGDDIIPAEGEGPSVSGSDTITPEEIALEIEEPIVEPTIDPSIEESVDPAADTTVEQIAEPASQIPEQTLPEVAPSMTIENSIVLFEDSNIVVSFLESDIDEDLTILLRFNNKSNMDIYITTDEISVNGYAFSDIYGKEFIPAGTQMDMEVRIYGPDFPFKELTSIAGILAIDNPNAEDKLYTASIDELKIY